MSTASDATAVLSPRKQKTHRGKDQGEERRRKSSKKKSRSIRWKHLTDDVLSVVFSYLTIQDLSVTRVNHQFRSLYYQNVQRVDFLSRFSPRQCSQWEDGDLKESILRFSSLKYLSLDSCAKLTNETLQLLCERFQGTLEALLLGSCSLISERGLAQVASLPSLRSLSISGCSGLTAVGIERVLDTLPLLQRLDVSFLPQVTDRALIAVECMTNLLSLDLGCTRVTGAILELVPLTLRELRLSGCPLNLRTEILFNHGQGTWLIWAVNFLKGISPQVASNSTGTTTNELFMCFKRGTFWLLSTFSGDGKMALLKTYKNLIRKGPDQI